MKRLACFFVLMAGILPSISFISAKPFSEPSVVLLQQDVKSAIRQAQARYDSGNITGAADLAQRILAKYPENIEAKAILDKCIAAEREEYKKAVESMSVSQLSAFKDRFPNSEFLEDVSKRIADLPLWLDAKGKNTLDSYKQYLSESSNQIYKKDAESAIQELTVKQAYDAAVAANTIKSFEQFRSNYPGSKFDKDASNKIARLMADKFNSKSTYSEKMDALAYAKNEITRDYVNNKYNSATRNKTSSSSKINSTSHSSSSVASNRSTANSLSQSNDPTSIRFGVSVAADFSPLSDFTGDGNNTYSYGIGAKIRFGDQRWPLNMVIGANVYNHRVRQWVYSIDDDVVTDSVTEIVVSPEFHWNMFRTESVGMYLGVGGQIAFSGTGKAVKVFFGVPWLHGDWNVYYIKYIDSPYLNDVLDTPCLGTSFTYYF